jgi:alpha-amylase/alpha-mannosidase (GH57 family)
MRYVCIHGHFYQPPRENPWLEEVEVQDSAAPSHDWNARITAECYWPNAAARVLGEGDRITAIVNNYAAMSFNIGPTLCAWFARHEPALLSQIVAADRLSCERYGGHGSALAQAYGHAILPLATGRDKTTQVYWGVQDFVFRFGRKPEGLWLPETAVDTPTLETLAAHGIAFAVLAPHQAHRVRPAGQAAWTPVTAEQLDTTQPYLCRLPSGKQIVLFFYHAALARGVAFEGLLNSGDHLVGRLLAAFKPETQDPQLVHLATDGESYGHHHRFGEMALAFAVNDLTQRGLARLTNYGEYLALHPPRREVEIVENSSWSCAHGVERWRADCGCRVGRQPGWTQQWRAPLRAALDWLQEGIDQFFERDGSRLFSDPWGARNDYITVVLERTPERVEELCARHGKKALTPGEKVLALKLLEMQRHRLLMFTSCGWFFDELSGLEGTQILRYAARAVELAAECGADLEVEFVQRLRRALSNLPAQRDGAQVYAQRAKSARVDFPRLVANQAICTVLEPRQPAPIPAAFSLACIDYEEDTYGTTALGVGRMTVSSRLTREAGEYSFAMLKLTDHDVHCVVNEALAGPHFVAVKADLLRLFARHSLSEVVRALDHAFGETYYTAKDLLLDDRRRVLARVGEGVMTRLEETYRQLYRENRRLMEYLRELDVPLPQGFALAAGFLVNRSFSRVALSLLQTKSDGEELEEILTEARKWKVSLETKGVEGMMRLALQERLSPLLDDPLAEAVPGTLQLLDLADRLGLTPDLWQAQTLFAQVCRRHLPSLLARGAYEGAVARQVTLLCTLGERLGFSAVEGIPLDTWGW